MQRAQPLTTTTVEERAKRFFPSCPIFTPAFDLTRKKKVLEACSDQMKQFGFYILIDRSFGSAWIRTAMIRRRVRPRVPCVLLLLCSILLSYFPALISAAVVTLDSIEIFRTHEWFPSKPMVYFRCKGENITDLPDVKEKHVFYAFKGEESWQPLTELQDIKCKRCGFYEKDAFKPDVFDEWELCASDFTRSDGKYVHFKAKELNSTFLCPECVQLGSASNHSSKQNNGSSRMHWALVVIICVLVSFVFVVGLVTSFKYWQKRKREQEQARFLKLFEEGDDDIEDELGIGPLSHTV